MASTERRSVSESTATLSAVPPPPPQFSPTGSAFWMSFLAIVVCMFLSAMDLTGVSVVLPTVTKELNGGDNFVWVGSAYSLASTAILPSIGGLSDIFGRKPVMMTCIFLFALGSALAGAAQSMNMLIGARGMPCSILRSWTTERSILFTVVQGLGGGGIMTVSNIIISDLVPLSQRGLYQGFIGLTFALASGIGPPVVSLYDIRPYDVITLSFREVHWRRKLLGDGFSVSSFTSVHASMTHSVLPDLNLPLTGIAMTLVFFYLRVKIPPGSMRSKLARIDWL